MRASVAEAASIALVVNGAEHTTTALTLEQWVDQQGLSQHEVATALNSQFVPRTQRFAQVLAEGDSILTVQPIEGG